MADWGYLIVYGLIFLSLVVTVTVIILDYLYYRKW